YNLKGMSYKKEITFDINLKGELRLKGDKEKISIVLTNLLNNAIKYSPHGGWIKISAYEKEDYIRVEIEDEGPGIPENKADKIFEKFYKENSKGSGLGLTIAKAYIEAHKGKIGVVPRERGGHFYFELPKN
ncbi:MAG: sensor histidine kinase, partial [bacterium]